MSRDSRFAATLVVVFLGSSAVSSTMLYRGLLRQDCGLRQGQARTMVIEDLREHGWPVRELAPVRSAEQCRFEFSYGAGATEIRYAVSNDWWRGARVARVEAGQAHASR
jgi:hypothetical protein